MCTNLSLTPASTMYLMELALAFAGPLLFILWFNCCSFLIYHLWRPKLINKIMSCQGVTGPLDESSLIPKSWDRPDMNRVTHNILPQALPVHAPLFQQWGAVHMYWWSPEPRMDVADIDLARNVLIKGPKFVGKSPILARLGDNVFGGGLFDASGEDWEEQRRVVMPAFHKDKVKGMAKTMYECTESFFLNWEKMVTAAGGEKTLDVFPEFVELTGSMIGRAAFGASSSISVKIVSLLRSLLALQGQQVRYAWTFPFIRYLPFLAINRERWRTKRQIHKLLQAEINSRRTLKRRTGAETHGNDFFGWILDSGWDDGKIISQSKTIYTTGHMSPSSLYSWLMLLLAVNPQWQEKARAEVVEIASREGPLDNTNALDKLKLVEMIILETLRLYPPIQIIPRVSRKGCNFGQLFVPEGLAVDVHASFLHHSAELWGEDPHEFRPERFAEGSAGSHPMAFMPFSFGPRACVGRAYTMVQAKVVVAALLQRFSWSLSPDYRHNPSTGGTLYPKHGVQIILKMQISGALSF